MADLEVPLDLLSSIAGRLDLLMEEFSNAGHIVESGHEAVGSGTVIDALGEFSDNWDTHREEMLNSMKAVRDMAGKGREAYISADDKLAQDIMKSLEEK